MSNIKKNFSSNSKDIIIARITFIFKQTIFHFKIVRQVQKHNVNVKFHIYYNCKSSLFLIKHQHFVEIPYIYIINGMSIVYWISIDLMISFLPERHRHQLQTSNEDTKCNNK